LQEGFGVEHVELVAGGKGVGEKNWSGAAAAPSLASGNHTCQIESNDFAVFDL